MTERHDPDARRLAEENFPPQDGALPSWLAQSEEYEPLRDNDAFVAKSLLSVTSVLRRFRFDDGESSPFSPSPAVKLVLCLCCLLLTSLTRNYLFVLVMLAVVLVRACLLPGTAIMRVATTALGAEALSVLVMLPALFLGQGRSILMLSTKVLVSVSLVLCTSLSSTPAELTRGLRALRVPSLVILTIDLALKGIVDLGTAAAESLSALGLRSVGRNAHKGSSLGGVAGVVFVKASRASEETYQAMRCRGFEGDYPLPANQPLHTVDWAWMLGLTALIALFLYLQGVI